jgi:predicted porin
MKKLLCSAAVCGLALASTPAHAQGVVLELGGFFKGYGAIIDQDDDPANDVAGVGEARDFDIIRHTEVHMGGETTLDNGLTVGVHIEAEADGDSPTAAGDSFDVEESYAYFSGGWGRVNFGAEDGAAYLLQVAAPSADENVDGIRQFVQPFNYASADGSLAAGTASSLGSFVSSSGIDYEQNTTGFADKLTYLSPIFNGFQVGVSYTPDVADTAKDLTGVGIDDADDVLGEAYEGAFRYEGQFNNAGIILGAGYTYIDQEDDAVLPGIGAITDERAAWNVGIDVDIGPFGVGAIYKEDDYGEPRGRPTDDDEETMVLGVDYTTGAFRFGGSVLDQENTGNIIGGTGGTPGQSGIETRRYTGGLVYTYGPGMTFRGSISYVEHDNVLGLATGDEIEATSILLGTQINF